jgi:hypothetical protein
VRKRLVQTEIPNPKPDEKGRFNAPKCYDVLSAVKKLAGPPAQALEKSDLGMHLLYTGYLKLVEGKAFLTANGEEILEIFERQYAR